MQIRQEERFVPGGGYHLPRFTPHYGGRLPCDHGPRWVEVPDLYVDKYPVTNGMYLDFLTSSGYVPADGANFLKHWRDGRPLAADLDKPVTWVSPNDARAYAAFYGKSLPTDAEWQYFASGPRRLKWPWGRRIRQRPTQRRPARAGLRPQTPSPAAQTLTGCSTFRATRGKSRRSATTACTASCSCAAAVTIRRRTSGTRWRPLRQHVAPQMPALKRGAQPQRQRRLPLRQEGWK